MPDTFLLELNTNGEEDIQFLIESAAEISSATEADFESMKSKAWYKRFWNMITFSKDNEKNLAKGTKSLAKLQEITIQVMLKLSNENVQFAEAVRNNTNLLDKLANSEIRLTKGVKELLADMQQRKYGNYERLDISVLSKENRSIIISVLRKFISSCIGDSVAGKFCKEYLSYLRSYSNLEGGYMADFDYDRIQLLSQKEQELLFIMLCEAKALLVADEKYSQEKYEIIKEYISISGVTASKININVDETVKLEGCDSISRFYGKKTEFLDAIDHSICADDLIINIPSQEHYSMYSSTPEKCASNIIEKISQSLTNNVDINSVKIEVPSDFYDEISKKVREEIKAGHINGIFDEEKCNDFIFKGEYRYQQVINIAKLGIIETLSCEKTSSPDIFFENSILNLSDIVTFALYQWDERGREQAIYTIQQNKHLGKVQASCSNSIKGDVDFPKLGLSDDFLSLSDIGKMYKSKFSKFKALNNALNTPSTAGAGGTGPFAGASNKEVLRAFCPITGTLLSAVASASGVLTSTLADTFINDDASEMMKIIKEEFKGLAEDFLVRQNEEAQKIIDLFKIQHDMKIITELENMYASPDKPKYARELLSPFFEKIASQRPYVPIPTDEEWNKVLGYSAPQPQ